MSEAEVRERQIYVFNKLKKGWKVKEIVEELIDKYQLSENYANKFAYSCNKEFNESLKDISDNAANYCIGVLQGIVVDSLEEKDRTSALKAIDLLQKVTKVGGDNPQQDLNIRFSFNTEQRSTK